MNSKYTKENANDVVFNLEYNSERKHLIIPEYGRHLQKLIDQAIANSKTEEERLGKLGFIRARNEENIIHFSRDGFLDNASSFRFTLYDTDINL